MASLMQAFETRLDLPILIGLPSVIANPIQYGKEHRYEMTNPISVSNFRYLYESHNNVNTIFSKGSELHKNNIIFLKGGGSGTKKRRVVVVGKRCPHSRLKRVETIVRKKRPRKQEARTVVEFLYKMLCSKFL